MPKFPIAKRLAIGSALASAALTVSPATGQYRHVGDSDGKIISRDSQREICSAFNQQGFREMQAVFRAIGLKVEDAYQYVTCDTQRGWDVLRFRVVDCTGRRHIRNFIRYFKSIGREEQLAGIFNFIINRDLQGRPTVPSGTLLDFVESYQNNPELSEMEIEKYEGIKQLLIEHGAKRASEL